MGCRALLIVAVTAFAEKDDAAKVDKRFSEVEIDHAFQPYLLSNVLLMEVTGAKIIRREDGTSVLFAVSSTAIKDESAKEKLRAERVCRIKALASVVAEKTGIQIAHTETAEDRTVIMIDENEEKATSVSEFLEITKAKVQGVARDMPVVGRWKSKDGTVAYIAIGAFLDCKGEVMTDKEVIGEDAAPP